MGCELWDATKELASSKKSLRDRHLRLLPKSCPLEDGCDGSMCQLMGSPASGSFVPIPDYTSRYSLELTPAEQFEVHTQGGPLIAVLAFDPQAHPEGPILVEEFASFMGRK
ncbi:MAG: hypothetical protein Q7S31_02400 [bacterium]|nr:hypothetical protein [bacterium]